MDEIDELIRELKKTDTQEFMEKRVEKENKRKEKIINIVSSIDYIKWLIDFTKDKEGFTDNDWDYAPIKLSKNDQEKVDDLQLLFEGIYNYAKKNYIYSTPCSLGEYYNIKIGDIGFEIGYITGQGTMFYCKRVDIQDNFIDFMDILSNKKQDNVDYIEKELNMLSDMINNIYNNGIPIDAITETYNIAIRDIIKKERLKEDNKKILKTFPFDGKSSSHIKKSIILL